MSRIGSAVIPLPDGVKVEISDDALKIAGPKGNLETALPEGISAKQEDGVLTLERADDQARTRAMHGLARSLAANAVQGVSEGFQKELEIVGIGYRGQVQGKKAVFSLGFSHPVEFPFPEGIEIDIQDNTKVFVKGADKQKVGQTAAEIRALRPPDAYKGKGVRYKDERLRLKVGKAGVTTA